MVSAPAWLPPTAAKCSPVVAPKAVIVWSSDRPGQRIDVTGAVAEPSTESDRSFGKQRRLLTPRDFRQVFQTAAIKVSSKDLLILARVNPGSTARLGLVIAKKHVRRANQRNRIKRVIRESFRHQQLLAGLDLVVLARGALDLRTNEELFQLLTQLWQQLQRKHQRHPSRDGDRPADAQSPANV